MLLLFVFCLSVSRIGEKGGGDKKMITWWSWCY